LLTLSAALFKTQSALFLSVQTDYHS